MSAENHRPLKCCFAGSKYPRDYVCMEACFARPHKEAKKHFWSQGHHIQDECEHVYIDMQVSRQPEHDHLSSTTTKTETHIVRDNAITRRMGW
ncbi:MAG: hypothetical protein ACRD98_11125 [Nitrososphaera sp.]